MFRINCSRKPGLGLFLISLNEGKEKEIRIISRLQRKHSLCNQHPGFVHSGVLRWAAIPRGSSNLGMSGSSHCHIPVPSLGREWSRGAVTQTGNGTAWGQSAAVGWIWFCKENKLSSISAFASIHGSRKGKRKKWNRFLNVPFSLGSLQAKVGMPQGVFGKKNAVFREKNRIFNVVLFGWKRLGVWGEHLAK